ncbi:TadE/TadG family type IV pilus assembly protein [Trinickia mobilis]|uniref:TadE/TadG family type IV pilus assembly protein n=1 Tax=Trinickia mobilis TaxID=2816356 RepID=UPI001A8ED2F2|nr:TadE/TadG family type IV pilus assembly protein [Trinickia mobilis]
MNSKRSASTARLPGSAIIESVLVLPVLCLLLFGIVELAIGIYDQTVLANASREAALVGVAHSAPRVTPTQITSIARNYASDYLITFGAPSSVAVDIDRSSGTASDNSLKVTVSYAYSGLAVAKLINMLGGSLVLSAATTMEYE